MLGTKSGVAKQIATAESCAVYMYCYSHALNLALGDTVKQKNLLRDTLYTTGEISILLKYSPHCDSLFEKLKSEIAPNQRGFRTLPNYVDSEGSFIRKRDQELCNLPAALGGD